MIWSLYPERKVFVDGRAEVYDREFQKAFIGNASIAKWVEAVKKYGINYAVTIYAAGGLDPLGKWIAKDPQWVLIYWDDVAKVYARDIPTNHEIINRYGHYVMAAPAEFNYNSLRNAVQKGQGNRLEAELKNDIESNSENTIALYWLGMLYYETNKREEAVNAWEESVRIRPDANTFSSIGNVFAERGQYTKAIDYYKKAIEADKRFAEAYYNLGNAYETTGNKTEAVTAYKKFIKYAGPEYADVVRGLKKRLKEGRS